MLWIIKSNELNQENHYYHKQSKSKEEVTSLNAGFKDIVGNGKLSISRYVKIFLTPSYYIYTLSFCDPLSTYPKLFDPNIFVTLCRA